MGHPARAPGALVLRRRLRIAAALGAVLLACGGPEGPRADPAHGVVVLEEGAAVSLHRRAAAFYQKLALRRVNTYSTYSDDALREYFRSERAFSDYYADLVQSLREARFEQNRPLRAEVEEIAVVGPGRARVRVRFEGDNAVPLRFGTQVVQREDRWERTNGQWWVIPGKL